MKRLTALHRFAAFAVALGLLAATPTQARAGLEPAKTWAETVDVPALATHVRAEGADVVVVAAGTRSQELRDAARSIRDALDGAAGVQSAREGAGLGDVTDADDAAIVERAAKNGAGRVVIARLDDDGATSTLLVAVYDASGDLVGGFSAERGGTIPSAEARTSTGPSELSIVDGELPVSSAIREYERRRVVFGGGVHVTATGARSALLTQELLPHTGAGAPLERDEFYRYVGRDDLAKQYRARRGAKIGLQVAGWGSVLAGFTMMMALPLSKVNGKTKCASLESDLDEMSCESSSDAEMKRAVRVGVGGGAALVLGGITLGVVGARLRVDKTTAAEAMEVAEHYNSGLRKRLGVPDEFAYVRVAPAVARSGGGVVMSGRF